MKLTVHVAPFPSLAIAQCFNKSLARESAKVDASDYGEASSKG